MKINTKHGGLRLALCVLSLAATVCGTGCQMTIGGQTLPSPWYLDDDVQYYAPATEFKLPKEAAQMKQYKADQELQQAKQSR